LRLRLIIESDVLTEDASNFDFGHCQDGIEGTTSVDSLQSDAKDAVFR
jgi:hypothetical protein